MDAIELWLREAAGSPWLYPAVFLTVLADAFLVIIPSETAVVALGALAASTGQPVLPLLVLVAALGAVAGDNLCYLIGRGIGTERWGWMRRGPVAAALRRARRLLDARAATLILTARYIPFARIAVNLTAGSTGFPYRRFLPLSFLAGAAWALYNALIGAGIGRWLGENTLLGVIISVVVAVALGILIDLIISRWSARRQRRGTARRVAAQRTGELQRATTAHQDMAGGGAEALPRPRAESPDRLP